MTIRPIFSLIAVFFASAAHAEPPPASAYGRLPNVQSMDISPNGERLVFLAGNSREERSIVVASLTGEAPNRIPLNGERALGVEWMSDNRLAVIIYKYTERPGGERATYNDVRRVIMNVDGTDPIEVRPAVSPRNYLPDDPDHVLLVAGTIELDERQRSRTEAFQRTDIYRFNINTGNARRLQTGRDGTSDWVLGLDGSPVVRIDTDTDTNLADAFNLIAEDRHYYTNVDGGWKRVLSVDVSDDSDNLFQIAGFREGEADPYVLARLDGADKVGLYKFSLKTGAFSESVFTPPRNDLYAVLVDQYTRAVLGYSWIEGATQTVWWDDELAAIDATLRRRFPGAEIELADWSRDRSRFVVFVNGGPVAQNYYLYEPQTERLQLVASAYPEIPNDAVNPVSYIDYEARDGVAITAYLTLPNDRDAEDLPLVVLPHGGPEARDVPGFDYWPQFLASRGYAVVQPQFRHSSGYGRAFAKLGYGRWGREMQTDLSDAIDFLENEGVVDSDRVCIFGWSYGGYAALAGATITPEDYRCVVAGAPVSDLPGMLRWVDDYYGSNSSSADYWKDAIGSRFSSGESLAAVSPARLADNVRAPVLLIHGDKDLVVPIEQSEIMAQALEEAGKEHAFLRLEGENHNILYGETRTEMMQALEAFVVKHNPPD